MGKYSVSYEVYERYGSGGLKTAKFSANSDLEACKKIAEKLGLYVSPEEICLTPEEVENALSEGYEEDELYTSEEDVQRCIDEFTNSDGQDFIFWIKKPDGSFLYDSGIAQDDDWDD